MRVLLRTTLITILITISALAAWSLLNGSKSAEPVNAASGLHVPRYCVPPELSGIKQLLVRTADPRARQFLLAKEEAAQQAALDCAANATAHPPAPKPAGLAGVLLPTSISALAATLPVGIQHAELLPVDDFLPAQDGENTWAGMVNGHAVQVFAGSVSDPDENWQQYHPDGVSHPELHVQGALRVVLDYDGLKASQYPTAPASWHPSCSQCVWVDACSAGCGQYGLHL